MKAMLVERTGTPDVMQLRDVPRPAPRAGQVLLRVEAVGVNFADVLNVAGQYLTAPKLPHIPGMELAGTVEALGEGVSGVQVGQRVAALGGTGGLAEYAAVPAAGLVPVPDSFTPAQAAAFPVSYMTAYHALKTLGRGEAGEWVLLQAAAGALGTASVQLAVALGLKVIALASTEEKLQIARDLGAAVTILQDDPDRVQKVREAAGGQGVPLLLEVVGGARFEESLRMVAPLGRIVFIGNASREEVSLNPAALMKRNISVTGLWLNSLMTDPRISAAAAQGLTPLIASGKVVPQVGPTYALADSPRAFQDMLDRKTTGKVIIEPQR